MTALFRPRWLAAIGALLALGGAALYMGSAHANPKPQSQSLMLPSGEEPSTMESFLTSVTKDVDTYWTKQFKDSGLKEPRVSYQWIPDGQSASSACGGRRCRRRGLLPRRRHDLHLRVVRHQHLRRLARPAAAGQLAGLRWHLR